MDIKIFRKAIRTLKIVNNDSLDPISHKIASIHNYLNGLLNLLLSKANFQDEMNII